MSWPRPDGPPSQSSSSLLHGNQSRDSVNSTSSLSDTRHYNHHNAPPTRQASLVASVSDKFSLSPDPASWGADLSPGTKEPDDYLHNPDPVRDRKNDKGGHIFTARGLMNLGCLAILLLGIITLFAGYPIITYFQRNPLSTLGGFNLGGINATGQIPSMNANWGLIDVDTPKSAMTIPSYFNPKQEMELVFSDEFNTDGRTFYPGDDPYWEASDLHYWATNNLEWYDPAAITTKNGSLEITLSRKNTHGLRYEGGMLSSWNKFCFTGGIFLVKVVLPGIHNVAGLWPAAWAMGNLGRAGYGASLDGMWPYSYDACDVGALANQTLNGLPLAATTGGDPSANDELSYLPGQRLSRCTCPGESHPGPMHSDGTFVGRAAPEIDVFEAMVQPNGHAIISQSAQWAPFNAGYNWFNTTENQFLGPKTKHNTYQGGAFQQTTSGETTTNLEAYELSGAQFSIYGFEYKAGYDDAYISWISEDTLDWTVMAGGLGPDPVVEIAARPIPMEPMYLILNLGLSLNFGGFVEFERLTFPTTMRVDWVRVYQPKGSKNVGCDPKDFPTATYIETYKEAYTNPNLTTWVDDFKQKIPKNKLLGEC